ncbi:MAG TPA: DUF6064 family protein [Pseudobacteroides sp.]|uniref:DUF6064 family protein n=1 Tax=Pseudobacteroides sp. TaxID=1968840 RepID=UPI002F9459CA
MKSAEQFWNVISTYNQQTMWLQIPMVIMLMSLVLMALFIGKEWMQVALKVSLFVVFSWVGIIFFWVYDQSAVGRFFAGPLYILVGVLFLVDSIKKNMVFELHKMKIPRLFTLLFILLYALYPVLSFVLGGRYPSIVTLIMPCPLVVVALTLVCTAKGKINKLLLLLLLVWAFTGLPKSIMFNVYEDLILFISGLYAVVYLINSKRKSRYFCEGGRIE